ncbi:hypothetical protein ACE6H2_008159 [Prunus campanulata]
MDVDQKLYLLIGAGLQPDKHSQDCYPDAAIRGSLMSEELPNKIKAAGYVPDTSFVLHDVSGEKKEHNLTTHSEKLAMAFGLLNTSPGSSCD